jgi:hypothetical protein
MPTKKATSTKVKTAFNIKVLEKLDIEMTRKSWNHTFRYQVYSTRKIYTIGAQKNINYKYIIKLFTFLTE